jgi:transaldolase
VIQAFIDGIDIRIQRNESVSHIASVASFFLSRIDVLVDNQLDIIIGSGGELAHRASLLKGKIALASAGLAYTIYKETFGSSQFAEMLKRGAHPQMLLWASTSTKNPEYTDTMYVDPLIAPDTISTQPIETIEAYRDHGNPALRIEETAASAAELFASLARVDINIDSITRQLENEGVEKFSFSYDKLIAALEKKCREK